jgi:hypothetical protein
MENLLRLLIRTIICNLMIDESPEKKNDKEHQRNMFFINENCNKKSLFF